MKCSVTVLGAPKGKSPSGAAGLIADYLHGKKADRGRPMEGRKPPQPEVPERVPPDRRTPGPEKSDTVSGYYGDSAEGAGRWVGSGFGATSYAGEVVREEFVELLLGTDPRTGGRLLGGTSSIPRSRGARAGDPRTLDGLAGDELVGFSVAARFLGVSRPYLKDVAARTTAARDAGTEPTGAWLDAAKTGTRNAWQVAVDELHRFAASRSESATVLGYDVTFSSPKSVSLLWSMLDADGRDQILEAIEASVRSGIAYLEAEGCAVKVSGQLVAGDGLLAAGYLHATSRALDPQLHWHCVVLNATVGPDGIPRALDGRGLFAHAKTAAYLAGAQLRHELSVRLGVTWDEPVNGLADIAGFDRDTIEAFSKRSSEINEITEAAGLHTANGRQAAALASRVPKTAVDAEDLIDGWREELATRGYDQNRIDGLLRDDTVARPGERDLRRQFAIMLGPDGLTALTPVFDRRDVVQALAEWAGDRLTATEIADLADEFCCRPELVTLEGGWARPGAVILRRDGHAAPAASGTAYTTLELLEAEIEIVDRFSARLDTGHGVVDPNRLADAIARRASLGPDQAAMVTAICASGDQFQCVLGPAGSGKTFALEVAARAWEADGYHVLGAAVAGVAADVLHQSVGIETSTIASLLARNAATHRPTLGPRSVLLVDEASTVGTRDLVNLLRLAERTGATVRLVGDPAQHGSVTAGGMFAHLINNHPERTPELTVNRRQTGEELAEVRLALDDYRHGHIEAAIDRLDHDRRITTAESADELLDMLVADWYIDRTRANEDTNLPRSAMIAEHHYERAQLNARARAVLTADGTIHGPTLDVAGQSFQAGDEVISRKQARHLSPETSDKSGYIRNGTRGTVTTVELTPDHEGLWVDFVQRGEIFVPREFLEAEVRRGVHGGLTHAYALTSHAAQGETYAAGRHLATDRSSHQGVYVGLSRGRDDVRLYAVRHDQLAPTLSDDPHLPRLEPETKEARDAVAARLITAPDERHALEHGDRPYQIARLRNSCTPPDLHALAQTHGPGSLASRAWAEQRAHLATRACANPDPITMRCLGARPEAGPDRAIWDHAAGELAVHRAVHADSQTREAVANSAAVSDIIGRARDFLGLGPELDLGTPDQVPTIDLDQVPTPAPPPLQPRVPVMELEL